MNRFLLLSFIIVFLLTDCGNRGMEQDAVTLQGDGFAHGSRARLAEQAMAVSYADSEASPVVESRKLIKNGSIEFEVSDVGETTRSIVALTKEYGGYISSETQNSFTGSPRFEQTVRVPAEKLDEFIGKVEGLARKVDQKSISTQDVTEEFIDVETRLKTKKELESRYRELLKQANKVDDILAIETQLGNVRSEIESMEGRLTYLKNQVSFSTLTLTYYTVVSGNYGFGYRFLNSFGQGWNSLLDFVIALFEAWPFVLLAGAAVWLFLRWRRRRAK